MNQLGLMDSYLRLVHSVGAEISVTLLVSGKRITGHLMPIQRYHDWFQEVMMRAVQGGGHFRVPSNILAPLTEQQSAKVREEWPGIEAKLEESYAPFETFCLRNVTVHEVPPMGNWECPILLISTAAVAAVMPGGPRDAA